MSKSAIDQAISGIKNKQTTSAAKADRKAKKKKPSKPEMGHAKVNLGFSSVDNPYFDRSHTESQSNPRQIKAQINMNESIAAHWYHKDLIDTAQMQAATHFRQLWERSGATGASAMDYSAVKVDTSGVSNPISVKRAEAVMALNGVSDRLGPAGYVLIRDLCGECRKITDLFPARRTQDQQSKTARQLLHDLAVYFGYKKMPIR